MDRRHGRFRWGPAVAVWGLLAARYYRHDSRCALSERGNDVGEVDRKPITLDGGVGGRVWLWAALVQHLHGMQSGCVTADNILARSITDEHRLSWVSAECG